MKDLNIGEQGQTGQNPYLPFPIARREGLVDVPQVLNTPPGVLLANGIMPGASNGGAVILGGRLWGVDHVATVVEDDSLIITGSDKSAIDAGDPAERYRNIGIIQREGAIVFTNLEDERIVFSALIKRYTPWLEAEFTRKGIRSYRIGSHVIGLIGPFSSIRNQYHYNENDIKDQSVIIRDI